MSDLPVFRAPKRRKTATKSTNPISSKSESTSGSDSEHHQPSNFTKPKAQAKFKHRPGGISFSNTRRSDGATSKPYDEESMAMVPVSGDGADVRTHSLSDRFVMSGGGIGKGGVGGGVEDNENLTAYVDAEMARRRQVQTEASVYRPKSSNHPPKQVLSQDNAQIDYTSDTSDESSISNDQSQEHDRHNVPGPNQPPTHLDRSKANQKQHPHSSSQHQLTEVDLSAQPLQPTAPKPNPPRKKKPKIRLGRDGKPLRPRIRKPRDEDDVARGALVEQLLRDNGLGVGLYTSGAAAGAPGRSKGDDEDADERMEQEFMREFLERQQGGSGGSGGGKSGQGGDAKKEGGQSGAVGVLASGPRLGGSRSARARMVAALEKERDESKGKGA